MCAMAAASRNIVRHRFLEMKSKLCKEAGIGIRKQMAIECANDNKRASSINKTTCGSGSNLNEAPQKGLGNDAAI